MTSSQLSKALPSRDVENLTDTVSSFICMDALLSCVWVNCMWVCLKTPQGEERNKPPVDQLKEAMT